MQNNADGRVGITCLFNDELTWFSLPYRIVSIASGWHHCLVLDQMGTMFACGKNNLSQCSNSETFVKAHYDLESTKAEAVNFFRQIIVPDPIRDIVCGAEHCVGVAESSLWLWGWNEHGCLGTGDEIIQSKPFQLSLRVQQIVAGGASTIAKIARIVE